MSYFESLANDHNDTLVLPFLWCVAWSLCKEALTEPASRDDWR